MGLGERIISFGVDRVAAGEYERIVGPERDAPFSAVSGGRFAICVGFVLLNCLSKGVAVGLLGTVVERSSGDFGGTVAVLGGNTFGVLGVSPAAACLGFTTALIDVP